MKKSNQFQILILFISCFLIAPIAHATPIVALEASSSDIFVAESFQVRVIANGIIDDPFLGGDLIAFGFDHDYEPLEFSHIGTVVESPFFDDSGLFPSTDVAGSVFAGVGGDDILLATMSFTAQSEGNHTIGILSDIFDLNEGLITFIDGQIDITTDINIHVAAAPIPEPGTIFLLGLGFLGIIGINRHKISI